MLHPLHARPSCAAAARTPPDCHDCFRHASLVRLAAPAAGCCIWLWPIRRRLRAGAVRGGGGGGGAGRGWCGAPLPCTLAARTHSAPIVYYRLQLRSCHTSAIIHQPDSTTISRPTRRPTGWTRRRTPAAAAPPGPPPRRRRRPRRSLARPPPLLGGRSRWSATAPRTALLSVLLNGEGGASRGEVRGWLEVVRVHRGGSGRYDMQCGTGKPRRSFQPRIKKAGHKNQNTPSVLRKAELVGAVLTATWRASSAPSTLSRSAR
jgi:hypothetical protein